MPYTPLPKAKQSFSKISSLTPKQDLSEQERFSASKGCFTFLFRSSGIQKLLVSDPLRVKQAGKSSFRAPHPFPFTMCSFTTDTWTTWILGPEHLSLKVPNIEFNFDVSADSVQWQTATSKSNSRPYNSGQMSIRCKVWMCCVPKIIWSQKFKVELEFDVLHFQW